MTIQEKIAYAQARVVEVVKRDLTDFEKAMISHSISVTESLPN